jgi:glutamate formiminotransferase/formiminotetrahydrofolate cyclodeaminase
MNGNSEEEKVLKKQKIQEALIRCVEAPLSVAQKASSVLQHLYDLVPIFNVEAKSDFMVGVKCIETGIYGAALNVLTNLKSFDDTMKEKAELYRKTIEGINSESKAHCECLLKMLDERR